ncbi:MAG: hypothetical protein J6D46_07855 [Lachnospiraceae bacterium]|nr:hypothetical protein [Lachnospiraceae bacterium]
MLHIIHLIEKWIYRFTLILEIGVSILVVIGSVIYITDLPTKLYQIHILGLSYYLIYLFDVIIGIELIKVLVRKDLDSIVEVLLFTVTRHLIIEGGSIKENLIGVISIAILFFIRKYLFIDTDDDGVRRDYLEIHEEENRR